MGKKNKGKRNPAGHGPRVASPVAAARVVGPTPAVPAPEAPIELRFQEALAAHTKGDTTSAEAMYRAILGENPRHANSLNNLAVILKTTNRVEEAIEVYRTAIDVFEDVAQVSSNMAIALLMRRRYQEAADICVRALVRSPASTEVLFHLASAVRELNNSDLCRRLLEYVLVVDPNHAPALTNLGNLLRLIGHFRRTIDLLERAAKVKPDMLELHVNVADTYKDHGLIQESVPHYARAFAIGPEHAEAHSNLLLALNYQTGRGGFESLRAHHFWAQQHADKLTPADPAHDNAPDPDRVLRLGLISGDLRRHSVAYFLEPLFAHLDRGEFELHCYTNSNITDEYTQRFRDGATRWRDVVGMGKEDLARLVRDDGIDMLLDVSGHTGGNRLTTLALKPAPVQVTWLGYPNTTGMKAIDYRLTDAVADPIGSSDPYYTEKLVRLSRPFLCYRPPPEADLPVAPLPALANGHITFGSFNNTSKMSAQVLEVWGRILAAVPGSRLVLKGRAFVDQESGERFRKLITSGGAHPDQVVLKPYVHEVGGHFRVYDAVDIALDPFPYNGTTTTCEALWMGVPVVTLQGEQHAGRVGASLLAGCGLGDTVATTLDDYVGIAVRLAGDPGRLADLRAGMRRRVERSPLRDEAGFGRAFGDALRDLWHIWCLSQKERR
ncbi:MAG: tetratricopeptide repeat protein [Alphaproteobacteria bacterium]|nr:tetratricopeptide repeat protein [Alphaproteobacteria bacterium]MBF0391287.1 tetratricopeptide repeat protein [Alphaproteobacteria bacterium]